MCGIVGYTGNEAAAPILLDGLSKLEYRGYDSSGIAVDGVKQDQHVIDVIKAKGPLMALCEMTDNGKAVKEPAESGIPDGRHTGNLPS